MSVLKFQQWLNSQGAQIVADGVYGPATEAAALKIFSNTNAPAVTPAEIAAIAADLRVSVRQVNAVGTVESRGSGFDDLGRPQPLFERHKFHRRTGGRYGALIPDLSNPKAGGYGKTSVQWSRVLRACKYDPDAAFQSASWGKFQVLGEWYDEFGFATVWDFVLSMTRSEAGHYRALASYVKMAGLQKAMAALSTDPRTNRAFAAGYNGPAYDINDYDGKLAAAMGAGA